MSKSQKCSFSFVYEAISINKHLQCSQKYKHIIIVIFINKFSNSIQQQEFFYYDFSFIIFLQNMGIGRYKKFFLILNRGFAKKLIFLSFEDNFHLNIFKAYRQVFIQLMEEKYYDLYSNLIVGNQENSFNLDEILQFYAHDQQDEKIEQPQKPTYDCDFPLPTYDQKPKEEIIIDLKKRKVFEIDKQKDSYFDLTRVIISKNLNLNKFIHHQTFLYLKELQHCRLLSQDQVKAIELYHNSGRSFISHFDLFQKNKGIRQKCVQYYISSQFMKKILRSKMNFDRKISIIKCLEKVRQFAERAQLKKRWNKDNQNDFEPNITH